jgi:Fe-S-cluster containining protein
VSIQYQDAYCDVTEEDEKKLGRLKRHVLHPRPIDSLLAAIDRNRSLPDGAIKTKTREMKKGPLKNYEVCACHFLVGDIMAGAHCSIYALRPGVCKKAVLPGDKACLFVRQEFRDLEMEGA